MVRTWSVKRTMNGPSLVKKNNNAIHSAFQVSSTILDRLLLSNVASSKCLEEAVELEERGRETIEIAELNRGKDDAFES